MVEMTKHPNQTRYSGQVLISVDVNDYVYVVPAVFDGDTVFLKTAFPSRKALKRKMRAKKP
ncbi:MAG: hypothetical protein EB059_06000 [Alphaproteobacteria bacterium]|nr:hypothetical protein [Alphaproteobacteria bacterium]